MLLHHFHEVLALLTLFFFLFFSKLALSRSTEHRLDVLAVELTHTLENVGALDERVRVASLAVSKNAAFFL